MTPTNHRSLDELEFDNRFTRELPADPETENMPRQVTGACYSRVTPARAPEPRLVSRAREVAEDLDLDPQASLDQNFAEVFVGNRVLAGMDCHAACYGGHQFGHWAGQLGDGRAINLGEVVTSRGDRRMLQLKGAGPTPYSRSGDGFAVLRSSVREYLCSEAMHHLGVPTTRALSLVLTGADVVRDMFYNGNPVPEPGAVVCRVAPSFTRFGSFEIFASRGEVDVLKQLVDHTIATDFPHLGAPSRETTLEWFDEICRTTADMILHWMRVGFVHGVMNTDNMSVLGLTIDYGPYGWIDDFDPDWTPNTTDAQGKRYRFGAQPQIALWNLVQLANAIYPLIEEAEPLEAALERYKSRYDAGWRATMASKLGLRDHDGDGDARLIDELHDVLRLTETDMTIFYRRLADLPIEEGDADGPASTDESLLATIHEAFYTPDALQDADRARWLDWLRSYGARVRTDAEPADVRRRRMHAVNPKYVLRNYLAQLAIDDAEKGDFARIETLLDVMRRPYDEQAEHEEYAARRPEWARNRPGCSMLSCSS